MMPATLARWREAVPPAIVGITVELFAAALVLGTLDHAVPASLPGLTAVAFAVVGAVILHHRPVNRIGWLLCGGSVPLAVLNAGTAYALHSVTVAPLPATSVVETTINAAPLLAIGLLLAVLPQLFPTGAPISRRWGVPRGAGGFYTAAAAGGNGFAL